MFSSKPLIAILAVLAIAGTTQGAVISYAGFEENVEAQTDTPTTGWRNTTPTKTLDIDGDNILGTDGYSLPKFGVESLPSYISSVTRLAPSENGSTGWGRMDDPANPSGADTIGWGMWFSSNAAEDIVQFVITGSDLTGKTLRVGVFTSGYIGTGEQLHLTQTVGGSATAASGLLSAANTDGLDVAYFDLTGVSAGDTFKVHVTDKTLGYAHASGLTFDTVAIPEPASLAMGLVGLTLIARRRRMA